MSELAEFRKTLGRTPEAGIELSDDTRARYLQGQVPQVIRWLVRYPQLIEALMRDAQELAAEHPAPEPADVSA